MRGIGIDVCVVSVVYLFVYVVNKKISAGPSLEGPPGCERWELFLSTVRFSSSTDCFFTIMICSLLLVICSLLLMICNLILGPRMRVNRPHLLANLGSCFPLEIHQKSVQNLYSTCSPKDILGATGWTLNFPTNRKSTSLNPSQKRS